MWKRVVCAAVVFTAFSLSLSAGIAGSRHDLSTSFEPFSDQVCAFCHTPHFANTTVPNAPLWNRFVDTTKGFTLYNSPSMDTTPGQPALSISMLCLGCHDGTLAYTTVRGIVGSDKHDLINAPGPGGMPDTTSYPNCDNCHTWMGGGPSGSLDPRTMIGLNLDLSNDHPVNMTYPTAAQDPLFNVPPDPTEGWTDVKLFAGTVQCPTCHNPHDPSRRPFLRKSNAASDLCKTCHIK